MFLAKIVISKYNENPDRALNSILKHKNEFTSVYIITYNKGIRYDKEKYKDLTIMIKPRFSKKNDVTREDKVILEIPPTCSFTSATLDKIKFQINHSNPTEQTFGVRTVEVVDPTTWTSWWMHGYLVLMCVWDWFHMKYDRLKIYRGNDIVARCVIKKCDKTFIARKYSYSRFINNTCAPSVYDDTAVNKLDVSKSDSYRVLRNMKTHPHYGWGLWSFYYFFFWCWCLILLLLSFQQNLPLFVIACIWLLIMFTSELITNSYMKMGLKWMYSLLLPLYALTFPVVIVYARFRTPTENWK